MRAGVCRCVGHGGDNFLKFQDAEEIHTVDLADAFAQMWQKKRYTCGSYRVCLSACSRPCVLTKAVCVGAGCGVCADRYNSVLFMVDTCQAATMFTAFYSPNIIAIGSAKQNENSYAVPLTTASPCPG